MTFDQCSGVTALGEEGIESPFVANETSYLVILQILQYLNFIYSI